MRRYGLYIFDLDGTLVLGEEPIDGAADVVAALRSDGRQVRFLTNNSALLVEEQVDRLRAAGFEVRPNETMTSAMGAAEMCRRKGWSTAYVVGERGLVRALEDRGVRVTDAAEHPEVVIVGICRWFTYSMMAEAMNLIRSGAQYVATNPDPMYPLAAGRREPGAGSIVAAIETCSGSAPIVIGKPSGFLIELLVEGANVAASDTLVVGDQEITDMAAAEAAGCDGFLVSTGIGQDIVTSKWPRGGLADLLA